MNERQRFHADGFPVDPEFSAAVLWGLSQPQKSLPCRYFYDAHGSDLFEKITTLAAYYPTRAELDILGRHAPEIAVRTPPASVLVEYGSGSSRKTQLLIEAIPRISAYVPIDVSHAALAAAATRLTRSYPWLTVLPVEGDFTSPLSLPEPLEHRPKIGFFPGSTIGNLIREDARALLVAFRTSLGSGARLVIGVDLIKHPVRLHRAYNDEEGVTAAFNLNLLARINRELDGTFDLAGFRHEAVWNESEERIEMHLVSLRDQNVRVLDRVFGFRQGEWIHTENSHKYTIDGFRVLAAEAGWQGIAVWTDPEMLFSVHELVAG